MCTHCLFLYILHTTDIITLWALPSLFPSSKHFFYFFIFQSLEVKKTVGTEVWESAARSCASQSPRSTDLLGLEGSRCERDGVCVSAVLKKARLSHHSQHNKYQNACTHT